MKVTLPANQEATKDFSKNIFGRMAHKKQDY